MTAASCLISDGLEEVLADDGRGLEGGGLLANLDAHGFAPLPDVSLSAVAKG
jgi:hypothetical protein